LADNLPRLPTARPAPISLRSSGPLSVQVEVSQLHLTAWPDGHLNYTHPYTAERPENSTTSVDANPISHPLRAYCRFPNILAYFRLFKRCLIARRHQARFDRRLAIPAKPIDFVEGRKT